MTSIKDAREFEANRIALKRSVLKRDLLAELAREGNEMTQRTWRSGFDMMRSAQLAGRHLAATVEECLSLRRATTATFPELASRAELQELRHRIEDLICSELNSFEELCEAQAPSAPAEALKRARLSLSNEAEAARTNAHLALRALELEFAGVLNPSKEQRATESPLDDWSLEDDVAWARTIFGHDRAAAGAEIGAVTGRVTASTVKRWESHKHHASGVNKRAAIEYVARARDRAEKLGIRRR